MFLSPCAEDKQPPEAVTERGKGREETGGAEKEKERKDRKRKNERRKGVGEREYCKVYIKDLFGFRGSCLPKL